jgi:lysophospholipase L1-like esterase
MKIFSFRARVAAIILMAAAPLGAQSVDLSKYVAIGDSLTAGYGAGCLVERHQIFSFSRTLARQMGIADFQQPTISDPGIPTCNAIQSLVPLVIGPISTTTGAPTNLGLTRPYDNLGIPGAVTSDLTDTVTSSSNPFFDIVLRGQGTAVEQALSLNPTFMTVEIGPNDILNAVGAGLLLDGVTATPLNVFTAKYNALAASLKASGRTVVLLGLPNVTSVPLATTIPPVVVNPATNQPVIGPDGNPIPLLGPGDEKYPCPDGVPACPVPAGTLVTLGASSPQAALGGQSLLGLGFGIPCAVNASLPECDQPLPVGNFVPPATLNVGVLLYPDAVAAIVDRVEAMNSVVQAAAQANDFGYYDVDAFLQDMRANGRDYGGIHVSVDFVTGGFFSFGDPVHPSNVGYTIFADDLIQWLNATYKTSIPRPDVATALFTPDVPAAGTSQAPRGRSLHAASAPVIFPEHAWRAFLATFPPVNRSIQMVLPGRQRAGSDAPVRVDRR